ncbi:hypothetical protein [Actinomadura parmotrematis]|uniref:Uncharacterized protein n=1 Tax=Actinomadura parmotrematis TaxID=2864039 RepID=A0ABS7G4G4_9ACTN|nr:hypothetical protein [Actinomadura parmotrematis]MBW8487594.1 hypothetical protein [Actinomadura parmotrematis]
MVTAHKSRLRDKYLSAEVSAAPAPWRRVFDGPRPVGGLLGAGFAVRPEDGRDLLLVVSHDGYGLFDTVTGERVARERTPDPADDDDLVRHGIGPVAAEPVRIAGLFGGGLHTGTGDGWSVEVVAPGWPDQRVILSSDGGQHSGSPGGTWWHVRHVDHAELRAAGFAPSGETFVVATSADVSLWTRARA